MINMTPRLILLCILGLGSFILLQTDQSAECSPRTQIDFEDDFDEGASFGGFGDEEDADDGFEEEATPAPVAPTRGVLEVDLGALPKKAYSPDAVPESHHPLTTEESLDLLDRAEALLSTEAEMSPLEMIQAVTLLIEHGREGLTTPYVKSLLRRFNDKQLTDRELFDIADRLGASNLAKLLTNQNLSPEAGIAVDSILKGYQEHLSEKDAVESVLLWKELKTPKELMNAANELSKVGRIEIAGVLLKRFLDTEATPEQLAEINVTIGTADIIRILAEKELQPQGRLAVERVIEGTQRFRQSLPEPSAKPELNRIRSGRPEDVTGGVQAIWHGSEVTLPELIEILCTTQDQQELAEIDALLRSMWNDAQNALAVMLESSEPQVVQRCAQMLYARVPTESAYLFYPGAFGRELDDSTRAAVQSYVTRLTSQKPTPEEAALQLVKVAREFAGRDRVLRIDSEGLSKFWVFDAENGKAKLLQMPAEDAFRAKSSQLATYAYRIAPELPRVKVYHFLSRLEQAYHENGLDKPFDADASPLSAEIAALSLEELEAILTEAVKDNITGAGVIAAEELGKRGNAESLLYPQVNSRTGRGTFATRALVQATQSSDRRIRFAATTAIVRLQPQKAYPGSSLVSESLLWFARSEGKPRVVIATPKTSDATHLAGFFHQLGYVTSIAHTSGEAMREALATPDVELVFIDSRCRSPIVQVFAQNMRIDAKTHEIPIAIFTRDENELKATPIVKPLPLMSTFERNLSNTTFMDSLSMVVPEPQDAESTEFLINRVKRMTGAKAVPTEIRLAQAKTALAGIIDLTENYSRIYRIENLELLARETAYSPVLYEEGLTLLSLIRSNGAQNTLVEIATQPSFSLQARTTARDAFMKSVEKHGVLIRGTQVKTLIDTLTRQYDQESPDPVLESIMETIELSTAKR